MSYTADALNRYTAVGAVSPTYDGHALPRQRYPSISAKPVGRNSAAHCADTLIELAEYTSSFRPRASRRYTTLPCLNAAISPAPNPNSASTSSVCSPNSGGRAAILLGVRDSVTGWPTRRM